MNQAPAYKKWRGPADANKKIKQKKSTSILAVGVVQRDRCALCGSFFFTEAQSMRALRQGFAIFILTPLYNLCRPSVRS